MSEEKDMLVKPDKTNKRGSKWIRRITPSYSACHWTKVTQQRQNCLQIIHLGNIIDSSVQKDAALWGLDINAGVQSIKTVFSRKEQSGEWDNSETFSQKTFWPVKEPDGICRAARGFAKDAPLGLKRQQLLTHASCGRRPGHLGAGQNKEALQWRRLPGTKDRQGNKDVLATRKRNYTKWGHAFKGALAARLLFLRFWAF